MNSRWLVATLLLAGCTGAPQEILPPRGAIVLVAEAEAPLLDGNLSEAIWEDARSWNGTFQIRGDPVIDGDFPMELRVLAFDRWLYVGVLVREFPPSAYGNDSAPNTDYVALFLTLDPTRLQSPSDAFWSGSARRLGSLWEDGFWNGNRWERQLGDDMIPRKGTDPPDGRVAVTSMVGDDVSFEFAIPRSSPYVDCDGFQALGADVFGLRIRLERLPSLTDPRGEPFFDYFPRSGPPPGEAEALDDWIWLRFAEPVNTDVAEAEKECKGAGF